MLQRSLAYRVFLILLVVMHSACSQNMGKRAVKIDPASLQSDKADSVVIQYSNNGFVRARLAAAQFIQSPHVDSPYTEMSGGLKVSFYNGNNEPTSVLTARSGRLFEKSNDVLVKDSVVIVNAAKGEKLSTTELIWNEKRQVFYTDKAVTIETPTQIIYGNGMEANQDFTYYKIINPSGVIAVPKKNFNL